MNVSNVRITDNKDHMTRKMILNDLPGKPEVADNVYVDESAKEIIYRSIERGLESSDERVFCARDSPLRMEMYSRHSRDHLRAHWNAPRSVAKQIFDEVFEIGQLMYNDPETFDKKYGSSAY